MGRWGGGAAVHATGGRTDPRESVSESDFMLKLLLPYNDDGARARPFPRSAAPVTSCKAATLSGDETLMCKKVEDEVQRRKRA